MLPSRNPSSIPGRPHAVAVEVRVPSEGTWFAALAATVRPDGLFLSTYRELEVGTVVILEISLPAGIVVVDGVVGEHAGEGLGIFVAFDTLDEDACAKLKARLKSEPRLKVRFA